MNINLNISDDILDKELLKSINNKIKSLVRTEIENQAQYFINEYLEPKIIKRVNDYFNYEHSIPNAIENCVTKEFHKLDYDSIICKHIDNLCNRESKIQKEQMDEINKKLNKFYEYIDNYLKAIPEEKIQGWFESFMNKKMNNMFNKK